MVLFQETMCDEPIVVNNKRFVLPEFRHFEQTKLRSLLKMSCYLSAVTIELRNFSIVERGAKKLDF